MSHLPLNEWISVDTAVARSVNLERDATDKAVAARFQVTPTAVGLLRRLGDALEGEPANAWSLTGPYGTGKSAFANFLLSLTCGDHETRKQCLTKISVADNHLAERLRPFVLRSRVPLATGVRAVSRYESLNATLSRALRTALAALPPRALDNDTAKLREQVSSLCATEWPATRDVVDAYQAVAHQTKRPVFLVVDEFGKNLEFQSHRAYQGDIFALQALAESKSVFTWVCLHQAFGAYAGALSRVQKQEWRKVQGRFEDRSYVEPPTRSFALIREALTVCPPDARHEAMLADWSEHMAAEMSRVSIEGMPRLSASDIGSLYPFHPLAVFFIGELTRRFAQYDRTVFSFMSSGEPQAFSDCLKRLHAEQSSRLPTLGLDSLYDYFSQNGVLHHADRSENQRWLEIHSLVSSQAKAEPDKVRILKVVGLLNLLSSLPGVTASTDMIHAALATSYYGSKDQTDAALGTLVAEQVLLYRGYAREYRLWEGTDFDLDREVLEARGRAAVRSMREVLEKVAPRPRLVAAKHSITSGTLREFAVRWCVADDIPTLQGASRPQAGTDGTVWLVLGRQETSDEAIALAGSGDPIIVGYSPCLEQVRELMLEAAATEEACKAPELERDGVARREARYRAAQARQALITFVDSAFSPEHGTASWFAEGAIRRVPDQRALSALASDLCDRIYSQCPRINNEMLNVDQLTSVAAAARNRVGEALANNPERADLGLTGFGPDVAVYRTVIKDTGLHRQTSEGRWALAAPDVETQPQLAAVWSLVDGMLDDAAPTGAAVAVQTILDALRKPPFGLRLGPAPLLLTHYLLMHGDDVAVYEEGVFRPFFGDAETMLLMRRPELFGLKYFKPSGIRAEVVRAYSRVVNTELTLKPGVRNQTLLSVVLPLTEFVRSLPEYTRTTRVVSPNAVRLRSAILNARDPEHLLFEDVPEALGLGQIDVKGDNETAHRETSELRDTLWNALVELRDAFGQFTSRVQARLVAALSEESGREFTFAQTRCEAARKAGPLISMAGDADLKAVLAALARTEDTDDEWLSQLAAIVLKKRLSTWRDNDVEPFGLRMEEVRERMQALDVLRQVLRRDESPQGRKVVVGIAGSDGCVRGGVARVAAKPSPASREMARHFESASPDTRAAWLACLVDTMERQGELA